MLFRRMYNGEQHHGRLARLEVDVRRRFRSAVSSLVCNSVVDGCNAKSRQLNMNRRQTNARKYIWEASPNSRKTDRIWHINDEHTIESWKLKINSALERSGQGLLFIVLQSCSFRYYAPRLTRLPLVEENMCIRYTWQKDIKHKVSKKLASWSLTSWLFLPSKCAINSDQWHSTDSTENGVHRQASIRTGMFADGYDTIPGAISLDKIFQRKY